MTFPSENVASENSAGLVEHIFDANAFQLKVQINYAEGPAHGPPLLLLHGLGRRWQVFLPVIPALSLRWHIFAPDLRGHGKSSRVARGYRGSQYAEDIVRFLRERISGPSVIFGHSLGGMVAMWIASHHPELVRALILGDNMISVQHSGGPMLDGAKLSGPMLHLRRYRALFSGLRDLTRGGGSVEQIAHGIGKIVLPVAGTDETVMIRELPGNDEAYLLSWARCVQQADPETYEMTLDGTSIEGWDGEALLRGIACPTLLLQASQELGGLMSDADVELATRLLPHHTHVKFRNLGHALFIQQPEPVLRAVTNFLESL